MALTKEDIHQIVESRHTSPFEPTKVIWMGAAALVAFFANDKLESIETTTTNNTGLITQVALDVNVVKQGMTANATEINRRTGVINDAALDTQQFKVKHENYEARLATLEDKKKSP